MRYCILVLLFFIPLSASAQNAASSVLMPDTHSYSQAVAKEKGVLIRSLTMEGFVLGDKDRFLKLFKPYRNKYLTTADMDTILQEIQVIYEKEGYGELVSITYQVTKHRLVFTALMIT